MKKLFSTIRENLFRSSAEADRGIATDLFIDKSIEKVVAAVDPKMRVVSRYEKRLRKPVAMALNYLDELVSIIPGEAGLLDQNELLISLLFKDQAEQDKVLSASDDLTEFLLQEHNRELPFVYFLLCMEKNEHSFFGVEQYGEILNREVQQASISFSGHQLLAPAATAELAREGFKQCAFNGLIGKIIGTIMQLNHEYKQLIESKSKINSSFGNSYRKSSFLNPYVGPENNAVHGPVLELRDINERINKIKADIASPESHLQQTIEILSHPQDFIKVKRTPIYVDKFGIKINRYDDNKKPYCIDAAQVEIDRSYKRIAVVAAYPVAQLTGLHQKDRFSSLT